MPDNSITVSGIEIQKMQTTESYRRPFSKLEIKINFSDSSAYTVHRDYVGSILTKAIPYSRISSSCEYGGHYLRQNVNGSDTEKRTRFSITDTSQTPNQVLVQCNEIRPELAKDYISKVIRLLKQEFEGEQIEVKGENLLDGKN
jgi:hypothetical protein